MQEPLSKEQVIKKYGYPMEKYAVVTDDGYCLTLFRITSGILPETAERKNRTVLLQHGITGTSADWVLFGPRNSLAFLLAEEGYDVWLGNARGNYYSRKHRNLTTTQSKFWNFSFHETGLWDLPATIDFILKRTGRDDLYYVGYSSGVTSVLVLCSTRPEYNAKLRAVIAIAPLVFVSNMGNRVLEKFILQFPNLKLWMSWKNQYEFPSASYMSLRSSHYFCHGQLPVTVLCNNLFYPFSGYELKDIDEAALSVVFSRAPTGTSLKMLEHYFQEVHSGDFRQFDYGLQENRRRYGQSFPPDYNLQEVTTKVGIIYSDGDILSTKPDVEKLYENLPNVYSTVRIKRKDFKHFDFIIGQDAKILVYDEVFLLLLLAEDLSDDGDEISTGILNPGEQTINLESEEESIIINFQNGNG